MNHEMEVEANRSGRKPGSERRDASASVGRAGNAACVLAHRIEDLRVLRIDVDSSAVPSLKSGPHCACAVGLDGSVNVIRRREKLIDIENGEQVPTYLQLTAT